MINYILCCRYWGFYTASSPLTRTLEGKWRGVTFLAPQGAFGIRVDPLIPGAMPGRGGFSTPIMAAESLHAGQESEDAAWLGRTSQESLGEGSPYLTCTASSPRCHGLRINQLPQP